MNSRGEVLLITFNHEKYIADALESIRHQSLRSGFVVKVFDDASTDRTLDIIREAQKNFPIEIQIFEADVNLGILKNYERAFSSVSSDWVAILEGDDCWWDSTHLQSSVGALGRYPFISGTFSSLVLFSQSSNSYVEQTYPEKVRFFTTKNLAFSNSVGNFSCCVYRAENLKSVLDKFVSVQGYDWLLNMLISEGNPLFHNTASSTLYRLHDEGLWSSLAQRRKSAEIVSAMKAYNKHFQNRYEADFTQHRITLLIGKSKILTLCVTTLARLLPVGLKQSLKKVFVPR